MKNPLPYCSPTEILDFLNEHPANETGERKYLLPDNVEEPTISDYYSSIVDKIKPSDKHLYYTELLKVFQLITNEGLISPLDFGEPFKRKFQLNQFDPMASYYGKYDFLILGFSEVRKKLKYAVRPIILDNNSEERNEDIGTGFYIYKNTGNTRTKYFVTAKHCIKKGSKIQIPISETNKANIKPEKIYFNDITDLCVIELNFNEKFDYFPFEISSPNILDSILILGYPKIQGFIDAIQIAESSKISSFTNGSEGEITGIGKNYNGGLKDHFLISARVKGGNSGSPVINKLGEVVGIVTEILFDEKGPDLLGFGVALSADELSKMVNQIKNSNFENISEINFKQSDDYFTT